MGMIVSGVLFFLFYQLMYCLPLIAVSWAVNYLTGGSGLPDDSLARLPLMVAVVVVALFLPGYRAKLAAGIYAEGSGSLVEAHVASGILLRGHLSFLPVVGWLFREKG